MAARVPMWIDWRSSVSSDVLVVPLAFCPSSSLSKVPYFIILDERLPLCLFYLLSLTLIGLLLTARSLDKHRETTGSSAE